jgi:hypothetical protein
MKIDKTSPMISCIYHGKCTRLSLIYHLVSFGLGRGAAAEPRYLLFQRPAICLNGLTFGGREGKYTQFSNDSFFTRNLPIKTYQIFWFFVDSSLVHS